MSRADALLTCQRSMGLYSRHITGMPLYPYQSEWADYILSTVDGGRNETITVEMPRQSGKNETSAQIEVALLSKYARRGGDIVKCAPTWKPQIVNSKLRFDNRARQVVQRLPFLRFKPTQGYIYRCGQAAIQFLSAAPEASVVGATASILMEVDETQDVSPDKFDKDFSPMRASTAAPLIAYGTTWDDSSLLEAFKRDIYSGAVPGKVFQVYPETVAMHNPKYGEYVDREVRRLGRDHPFIRTQFFLEPLTTAGRMLTETQLRSIVGTHNRQSARQNERIVIAGLDFAGADESAGEMVSASAGAERDSVALTVACMEWKTVIDGTRMPFVRILARYEWVDVNPVALHGTLLKLLKDVWKADRLHADATGIGSVSTAFLKKALDSAGVERVFGQTFDGQLGTHTRIAFRYLMAINSGGLSDYAADTDPVADATKKHPNTEDVTCHAWWQRGHAKLISKSGQRVKAFVPTKEGHDDLLYSEMLCVDAAFDVEEPRFRVRPTVRAY